MNMVFSFFVLSAFTNLTKEFYRVFVEGTDKFSPIFGSPEILAVVIFIFIMVFTLVLGLGMLVGCVVVIPGLFLVFAYVPDFQIFIAIILGLIVGLGLNKVIKR